MVEAASVFLLDGDAGVAMIVAWCADKKGPVSLKLRWTLRTTTDVLKIFEHSPFFFFCRIVL